MGFSKDTFFPTMLTNMVGVGEESGELAQMLLKVANTYENEVAKTVKTIVSLLEPSLILILGAVIGFLAFSMLLPIFQINFFVE